MPNKSTYVSYISGIGFKSFIADAGRELPTANPVSFSDADFAKYVARKAAFVRVLGDLKTKSQARHFVTMANFPGMEPNSQPVKEFKDQLNYVISKPFTSEDLHHYALAPNNPTKYSKNGRLPFMANLIKTVLKNDNALDATFSTIQQAFEVLQGDQNGKGAFYFLYLFLPKGQAELIPAVAKKQKAQEHTLKLLQEGLGVELEDLKMFVRRITRRNLLKEPETLINDIAKRRIISPPNIDISNMQQATTAPVRGNTIGDPLTIAIIGLVTAIVAATGGIVSSIQQRKLEEARLSIKPENIPAGSDFPATVMPLNTTGNNNTANNNTNQSSNTMLLLGIGAAVVIALTS